MSGYFFLHSPNTLGSSDAENWKMTKILQSYIKRLLTNINPGLDGGVRETLFPEPLLHMDHVLLHGVERGLGADLVSPPNMNTDDGMLELEVLHSALEHLSEVGLGTEHVEEELRHPPHYRVTVQP